MLTAFWATVVLGTPRQAPQDTQTYTDPQLGLSFTHPTTWVLTSENPKTKGHHKKKKSDDDSAHFTLPLQGATSTADLLVMRASFSGSADVWQMVQADANKNMKRTVEKQWQEEILGVPLLLTKIDYTDNGEAKTTVTGLLYNASANKFLFRLTGPAADFDKAQYEFDNSMQSLRTLDNTLPKAQEADKPVAKEDERGLKHVIIAPTPPPKYRLAPIAVPITVSTKSIVLRIPKGWSAKDVKDNVLTLDNPELGYPVQVTLATSLDSDPPSIALSKANGISLADFRTVTKRYDSPIAVNDAGCTTESTWRDGLGAHGKLMSMEAVGVSGDFYFIASCRPVPGPTYIAQKKLIDGLLSEISIDIQS
jgi:hypothetical protein